MTLNDSRLPSPHFPLHGAQTVGPVPSRSKVPLALPAQLMRAADCLVAALQNPTAEAGLNESRYRVLAALHAQSAEECSQADLAGLLLQSESNLSTLLERMSVDGLIARRRSETDRRRSLIRLTADGRRAVERAARLRAAAVAQLMRPSSPQDAFDLTSCLTGIIESLERSLNANVPRGESLAAPVHRNLAPFEVLARP